MLKRKLTTTGTAYALEVVTNYHLEQNNVGRQQEKPFTKRKQQIVSLTSFSISHTTRFLEEDVCDKQE